MIEVLIFDLDDTLFETAGPYQKALEKIGISEENSSYLDSREQVRNRLGSSHVSFRNRILYFKEFLVNEKKFSPETLLEMMSAYEHELFVQIQKQGALKKTKEVLAELKKTFRLAVLTNENTRTQMIKMKAIDPDSALFECIVTSEECGVQKPHVGMFERVLGVMGVVPQKAAMIGDSLECDILPALALGMQAVHTAEFLPLKEELPWKAHSIQSIEELVELAKAWRSE